MTTVTLYITPVLRQLHWLPVRQRVEFKIAVLVYKSPYGLTPPHFMEAVRLPTHRGSGTSAPPVSGCSHLRSPSDTDMARRQKFRGCWTSAVE